MKIAVDYHLANARESGMARYIRETLAHLQKEDPSIEYVLVDYPDLRVLKTIPEKLWAMVKEIYNTQITILLRARKEKAPVIYIPNPPSPIIHFGKRVVVNIPDLSFWVQEKPFWPIRLYAWFWYAIAAHTADHITTFSENSVRDIVRVLHVSAKKITVVPLGVDEVFFGYKSSPNVEKTNTKLGINRSYILTVLGAFVARKNAKDLIEAYVALPPELKKTNQLVLVAKKNDWYYQALMEYVQSRGIKEDIVYTGKLTEEELYDLYAGANVFAFPSLYEGFGMPPIEAMAMGIPTVVYNNSSLPEVVGDAALIVNNQAELRESLVKLLQLTPAERIRMVEAGRKRAEMFAWEHPAKVLHQVISAEAQKSR